MKKTLEICCVSLKDCIHAQENGADRIELCASMAAGGLTPSFGMFQLVKKHCHIPIMIMIRPRGAGFCYNEEDFMVMKEDANYFLEHGADGIVFGCLNEYRHIDIEKTNELITIAHKFHKEAVFHRAIDQCIDIVSEANVLTELGIDRILTAGGSKNAQDHVMVLKKLQEMYGKITQIQMCGSIREDNVSQLIQKTSIVNVHSACRMFKQDASDAKDIVLSYHNAYDLVCKEQVKAMAQAMK